MLNIQKKACQDENLTSLLKKPATTYSPTTVCAVPSAQPGLTTLFGKGRGGAPAP